MLEIKLSADEAVTKLLRLSESEPVFILDSCGVGHLGSHLLIAGLKPVEVLEVSNDDADRTLDILADKLGGGLAGIFTLSYELGPKLQRIVRRERSGFSREPDLFVALFESLLIHDYDSGKTWLTGDHSSFDAISEALNFHETTTLYPGSAESETRSTISSSFTKAQYLAAVETIREYIRSGDTYQTNLTQQLRCSLPPIAIPQDIFWNLRRDHPAPFAGFLKRGTSTVVSASPERFFRVTRGGKIEASPIKGTRRRGTTPAEDAALRTELQSSEKDRAENVMIVDLMRNDLGRVCEYGTVAVEKLCDIEEHPTLFHLVSTIGGTLRAEVGLPDILSALFPCGSITGAPKIRTMEIIDEIEPTERGLSMGAIGVYLPESWDLGDAKLDTVFDLSVAIRTMVIGEGEAVFNVGGGVVIDSDPENEYEESLLKARSLLNALGTSFFLEKEK